MSTQATIAKLFRFEAAHQLPNHAGKCAYVHGHSYVVQVRAHGTVQGDRGHTDDGMVLDFAEVKEAWNGIHSKLDHRFLNDVLPFVTTAENLAAWMLDELRERVPQVCAVRVWETTTSWAEVCAHESS